jgi:hypothetical protein
MQHATRACNMSMQQVRACVRACAFVHACAICAGGFVADAEAAEADVAMETRQTRPKRPRSAESDAPTEAASHDLPVNVTVAGTRIRDRAIAAHSTRAACDTAKTGKLPRCFFFVVLDTLADLATVEHSHGRFSLPVKHLAGAQRGDCFLLLSFVASVWRLEGFAKFESYAADREDACRKGSTAKFSSWVRHVCDFKAMCATLVQVGELESQAARVLKDVFASPKHSGKKIVQPHQAWAASLFEKARGAPVPSQGHGGACHRAAR